MCEKTVKAVSEMLHFISNYKNQKMYNKAVEVHCQMMELSLTILIPKSCVKNQLEKSFFALVYVLDYCKTQQMCVIVVLEYSVMLQLTSVEHKTQEV